MKHEVVTTVNVNISIFYNVTTCSLVGKCWR